MTIFQANDSTLGYLYQFRFALLNSLRRWREGQSFEVAVEGADDVEFQVQSGPAVLYQLKHKLKAAGNLSDKSPDWWKTLRIWCDGTRKGTISNDALFYLVTSDVAPSPSAAECLLTGPTRDPSLALTLLSTAANTTQNKDNEAGVTAFHALPAAERGSLVSRIYVLQASANVEEVREQTMTEVRPAVQQDQVGLFVERLEGWWVRRVVGQLASEVPSPITSDQLTVFMDDLREQFSRESLPVDPDVMKLVVDMAQHHDRSLVRQMEVIQASEHRVMQAVRDYLRAMAQRSRWVRGQLLMVGEMDEYEDRLRDEWRLAHAQRCDELGGEATDDEMRLTGRRVLAWAESGSHHLRIRPKVDEPFLVRGSLHKLAEDGEIGWHPQFAKRLAELIAEESA